ncbi:hypothetical protein BDQ12DRAFT_677348 [Crucibulum laeve]|uniref:Uncharacterized protein n=1 Tax=Crucibulum laeve TaxID=68775 RepID=A0A5C3MDF7_9AGAR|nr:hypothetical protein BDQ12DRAFT_677348 [Crucibulum laeve]
MVNSKDTFEPKSLIIVMKSVTPLLTFFTSDSHQLHILKYCPTTNHVFLSLPVYFDRMSKLSQDATTRSFVIDAYNIHRLVIAGVTVGSNFF